MYGPDMPTMLQVVQPPPPRPPAPTYDRHVRRSGQDYAKALLQLLPQGIAWPRDVGSVLVRTITGLANVWGFVDSRAADLLEIESDPRKTVELLPDWERAWGLPDPCVKIPQGIPARQLALVMKMTLLGGQSRQFFIDTAKQLGYNITITEYMPYQTGLSRVGDTRWAKDNPDSPTEFAWQLASGDIRYYWSMHVDGLKIGHFYTGRSECGIDRLLSIQHAEDLECLFDRIKPAHTTIIFDYSSTVGLEFNVTYNSQYLALGVP